MSARGPFLKSVRGSVSSLGEADLIRSIRHWLGTATPPSPAGIGDDCAVLAPARGRDLITVDPVIYGVHFDGHTTPGEAGAKLLKRNLSDIAAMGGTPRGAVVALALDGKTSLAWLAAFYRGIAREARRYGVPIVGGDVAELSSCFVATLTLLGEAPRRVLTRAGARVGDAIYVTGALGRSLPTGHHHAFTPRLREGAWLAARKEVHAMMDVSDGLAKDLGALTPRGLAAAVVGGLVPKRGGADLRAALSDGEDYELLLAAAPGSLETAWRRAFPLTPLTRIGTFVRKAKVPSGTVDLGEYHGYEHLR